MSIIDSIAERTEAEAKMAIAPREDLIRDLEYWTVSSHEHMHEYQGFADRMQAERIAHAEAETWIALIADELVKRRREKTGS